MSNRKIKKNRFDDYASQEASVFLLSILLKRIDANNQQWFECSEEVKRLKLELI